VIFYITLHGKFTENGWPPKRANAWKIAQKMSGTKLLAHKVVDVSCDKNNVILHFTFTAFPCPFYVWL